MKLSILLFTIICSCFISCCTPRNQGNFAHINCIMPHEERIVKLKKTYYEWEKASNEQMRRRKELLFFQYFPCSFATFDSIYGYYPLDEHKGNLYLNVDKHLKMLFSSNAISSEIKTKRIVDIAKEANWDDSMEFQYYLQQDIVIIFSDYFNAIQMLNDKEIFDFWYYFFDGPHPENYNDLFKELYAKGYTLNKNIAELMQKAYSKLLSEKKCDGH